MTLRQHFLEKLVGQIKENGHITLRDVAIVKELANYANKNHNLNLSVTQQTKWGITLKIA